MDERKKEYSVKEIAQELSTSEETVRRWIRDEKLVAVKDSKKEGFIVRDEDLKRFLESQTKYRRLAATSPIMGALVGATTVGSAVLGGPLGMAVAVAGAAATMGTAIAGNKSLPKANVVGTGHITKATESKKLSDDPLIERYANRLKTMERELRDIDQELMSAELEMERLNAKTKTLNTKKALLQEDIEFTKELIEKFKD